MSDNTNPTPLLEVRDIVKSFGPNLILKKARFTVMSGEIHALLGGNGAGKSTLIKIASGAISKDDGTVSVNGTDSDDDPTVLRRAVAVVHQELSLLPHLTAAENIYLPHLKAAHQRYNRRVAHEMAYPALALIDPEFAATAVSRRVGEMTLHEQQMVEIARVLRSGAKLLLLDEPTANLTATEATKLFRVLRDLAARQKIGVVFVSHRMREIREVAQVCTMIRDGRTVIFREPVNDLSDDEIVSAMEGADRETEPAPHAAMHLSELPVAEVEQPTTADALPAAPKDRGAVVMEMVHERLTVKIPPGHVLGLAGAPRGPGEVLSGLIGDRQASAWNMQLAGSGDAPRSPRHAVKAGIGFVSGDRGNKGILPTLPIKDNLVAAARVVRGRHLVRTDERAETVQALVRLGLTVGDIWDRPGTLSGGTQQKVLIARWLMLRPRLLVLEEPTRGVDVTTKREIYTIIRELAAMGTAVVWWSTEHSELVELCDEVLTFDITGEPTDLVPRASLSEDRLALATGMAA